MTGLLSTIFSLFIGYTGEDLIGKIQEQYVIENYFDRVDSQKPLVYKSGRVLGQKFTHYVDGRLITGWQYTNRTDCGGIIIGYMMELNLIKTRRKDIDGNSFTYDGGGLNSYRLYKLGNPKKREDVVRGDFVYMEFDEGVRHIAVACNDMATEIYDLYKKPYAECRKYPFPKKALFASNGVVEFLKEREIILEETETLLFELDKYKNEKIIDDFLARFGRSLVIELDHQARF